MHTAMRFTIRSIAATLAYALLLNQFAYAATPQDATNQAIVAQQQQAAQQAAAQANADAQTAAQTAAAQAQAAAQAANSTSQSTPAPIQRPAVAPPNPNAPVPTQIAAAHNIFVANLGADDNFPINSTQAYTNVYAALQSWGHYTLVSSPSQADLVFQLRGIAPITNVTGDRNGVYSLTSPAFQLTIVDPKSSVALWTITSPVTITGKNQTKARWVTLATTNLVSRVKVIAGQPLTAQETGDLTTFPRNRAGWVVPVLIVGGVAALGVGTYFIMHNAYENSLASQKASQDAFCTAHGIPLNECAGG